MLSVNSVCIFAKVGGIGRKRKEKRQRRLGQRGAEGGQWREGSSLGNTISLSLVPF